MLMWKGWNLNLNPIMTLYHLNPKIFFYKNIYSRSKIMATTQKMNKMQKFHIIISGCRYYAEEWQAM